MKYADHPFTFSLLIMIAIYALIFIMYLNW